MLKELGPRKIGVSDWFIVAYMQTNIVMRFLKGNQKLFGSEIILSQIFFASAKLLGPKMLSPK